MGERIRRLVRFTLPYHARVVVASEGDLELLDLEGRQTWHFPQTRKGVYSGPYPWSSARAIEDLEALRADGAEYLLMPRTTFWWLDHYDALREHLANLYRVVRREETSALIIALHDHLEQELRDEGAPDGLPLPPPEMIALVIGNYSIQAYLETGPGVADLFTRVLDANGVSIASLDGILDFGCGSGRVMRRWKDLARVGLAGVDYNPYLVEWCSQALPFASFQRNVLPEPLGFDDESFDLVYSFSVFTHLDVDSQLSWMSELIRVLKPGGHLLITVHGTMYVESLTPEEQSRYAAGNVIVKDAGYSGSSACYVLHPKQYVESTLARELTLVDFVPGSADRTELMQDVMLLRKV